MKLNEKQVSTLVGGVKEGNEDFVKEIKDEIREQLQSEMEGNVVTKALKRVWRFSDYNKEIRERNAHVDLITAGEATELLSENSKKAFKAAVLDDKKMKIKPNTLENYIGDEEEKKRYKSQMNFVREFGTDDKKDFKAMTTLVKDKTPDEIKNAKDYINQYKESKNGPDKDYAKSLIKSNVGHEVLELAAKQPENVKKVEELEKGANEFKLSTGQHLKVVKMCASADSPEGAEARHNFMNSECSRGRAGKALGSLTGDLYKNKELTIMADKLAEFDKDKANIPDPFAKNVYQMDKKDRADAALAIVAKYPNIYNAMSEAYGKDMTNRQLVSAVGQIGEKLNSDLAKGGVPATNGLERLNETLKNPESKAAFADVLKVNKVQKIDQGIKVDVVEVAISAARKPEQYDLAKNKDETFAKLGSDNTKQEIKTIIKQQVSVGQYDVAPSTGLSVGHYDVTPTPPLSRTSTASTLSTPLEGNATTPPFGGIHRDSEPAAAYGQTSLALQGRGRAQSEPGQIYGQLPLAPAAAVEGTTYSPIPATQPGRERANSAPAAMSGGQDYGFIPAEAATNYSTPKPDTRHSAQYTNIPVPHETSTYQALPAHAGKATEQYTNIPAQSPQPGYGGVPSPINRIPEPIAIDARSAQYGAPKLVTGVDEPQKPTRAIPKLPESDQRAATAALGKSQAYSPPATAGGHVQDGARVSPSSSISAPGHEVTQTQSAARK